ncbi:uncharacterized protein LOC126928650 [Bombus affinis]|uniref:uncharacterized protein LOC126927120 n=1 Tax=Bombus affinis TaxID=309941 RepID=UPI0021B78F8D|nr:uncharacterized protein LOC126927120 [Bombus affinis]XP_050599978.1 uncharacterized protein LOC126928181 [Bombus affinis]XP_050600058.1 uncharacterized protein LOC126928290 [Bombus affinis]XP_050600211.1 uncharacterized protein LOC126928650 [Bombus affinis]
MPWVAACLDLLAAPILGYCLAVRKLALQAGFFQEETNKSIVTQAVNAINTSTIQKETAPCADTMAPSVEEQRQEPKDNIKDKINKDVGDNEVSPKILRGCNRDVRFTRSWKKPSGTTPFAQTQLERRFH